MSLFTRRLARLPLGMLIALPIAAGLLLLFPNTAEGTGAVAVEILASSYPLGMPVPATVTIDLEPHEFLGVSGSAAATLTLDLSGPQPVSFDLPVAEGPFSTEINGAMLIGTVAHTGVTSGDFSADGYGVGYRASAEGGTITVAFNLTQRILLDPAPLDLPQIPEAPCELFSMNLPGASGGSREPGFPELVSAGTAVGAGIPPQSAARGVAARLDGDRVTLGIIADGSGTNDLYTQFELGDGFLAPEGAFPLPLVGPSSDMTTVEGVAFINPTRIAVVGGANPSGNDAFVAILELDSATTPSNVTVRDRKGLSSLMDNRPGGIAFDGSDLFIAEFQDDPSQPVTVLQIDPEAIDATPFSFDVQLGNTGNVLAKGSEGLAWDPHRNRFFGVTEPSTGGIPHLLEFGLEEGLLAAPVSLSIPAVGQAITGLAVIDDPDPSAGPTDLLAFAVVRDGREVLAAHVPGVADVTGFTNEPQAVDRDPATGNFVVALNGDTTSRIAVLGPDGSAISISPLASDVEVAGATLDANRGYWVAGTGTPAMIYRVEPETGAILAAFEVAGSGAIGGLASQKVGADVYLYAYEAAHDKFHKIDASTGDVIATRVVFDNNPYDDIVLPSGANGAAIANVNGVPKLLAARFDQALAADLNTGAVDSGFLLPVTDIAGLGSGLLIAERAGLDRIAGVRLPGEAKPEPTTIGTYAMQARFDNSANGFGPAVESAPVSFDLGKLPEVGITVATLVDGQVLDTPTVAIAGEVDDRTVTAIEVTTRLVTDATATNETFPVAGGVFSFKARLAEGENEITLTAASGVPGTANGSATLTATLDSTPPVLAIDAVTSPTKSLIQIISGTFTEKTPKQLAVTINGATAVVQTTFESDATSFSHEVALAPNEANAIVVTLTDAANHVTAAEATIVVDTIAPDIVASFKPVLSEFGVRAGDDFFVIANATDELSEIASVNLTSAQALTHTSLAAVDAMPDVIVKKHGLATVDGSAATHVGMTAFGSGTGSGSREIIVEATDAAGNVATAAIDVDVVTVLDNRTAYLMPGANYVGFPLVPTTPSLDELLEQDVANANPTLTSAMQASDGRPVRLADVVEVVYTFDSVAGAFKQFRPGSGGPTDTFTDLAAFDGMIVMVRSALEADGVSYDVFDTGMASEEAVPVPIGWTVYGSLAPTGSPPPARTLVKGWNLWTPHAADEGLFDDPGFLRGVGLVAPAGLALSAITQIKRVDAVANGDEPGGFGVVVETGAVSLGPGDTLIPTRSYWTYMVDDATITP